MRKIIIFCCAFLPVTLMAQTAAKAPRVANPLNYAKSITVDDLKKHLYIIAGAEMEGRGTGTAGERRAAAYIENQFRTIGLIPGNKESYQLHWPVFQDSITGSSIEVNGKSFEANKDFAVNINMSYSSTMSSSEVVFVGYGLSDSTKDDYKGVDVKGKIVLVLPGGQVAGTSARRPPAFFIQEAAAKNGAAAVLLVQTNFPRPAGAAIGQQYTNGFRKTISPNTFTISEAVAEAIMGDDYKAVKETIKAGNAPSKTYSANITLDFTKKTSTIQSSNVIGYVEGSDKRDEFVFITAHYDHLGKRDSVIFYGADDDGSGTVSVLELAEAFAKAKAEGKGPRRTVVFMTVAGEERGLWGSAYYGDNPIFPLEKTTVDLNIDMIGRTDPERKGDSSNYVYVVGDDKLSTDLRPISEAMNKKYAKMELDYKFNDPNDKQQIYYRSDHYNFARKGVPIIFYFDGIHADYHRPSDTPDKINYELMTKRARFVFHTAWEMANRNEMLKRDLKLNMPGRN
jgi:Zn-dependent M28 family amino/carboxypeptidase